MNQLRIFNSRFAIGGGSDISWAPSGVEVVELNIEVGLPYNGDAINCPYCCCWVDDAASDGVGSEPGVVSATMASVALLLLLLAINWSEAPLLLGNKFIKSSSISSNGGWGPIREKQKEGQSNNKHLMEKLKPINIHALFATNSIS